MPLEYQPRKYRDKRRASAAQRGYDSRWSAEAVAYKRQHPWCLGCAATGLRVATVVVDHIDPHRGDRAKFIDPNNRQPACDWHHRAIKPMLEARFEASEIGIEALRLDSPEAIALTKAKRREPIGADGWLA